MVSLFETVIGLVGILGAAYSGYYYGKKSLRDKILLKKKIELYEEVSVLMSKSLDVYRNWYASSESMLRFAETMNDKRRQMAELEKTGQKSRSIVNEIKKEIEELIRVEKEKAGELEESASQFYESVSQFEGYIKKFIEINSRLRMYATQHSQRLYEKFTGIMQKAVEVYKRPTDEIKRNQLEEFKNHLKEMKLKYYEVLSSQKKDLGLSE